MKRKKILLTVGSLVLATAAFLATRANNKFKTAVTTVYIHTKYDVSVITLFVDCTHSFLTKTNTGSTAYFYSPATGLQTMFSVVSPAHNALSSTLFTK